MPKGTRRRGETAAAPVTVVRTADELMAAVERHELLEDARAEFNAAASTGQRARFWRGYQLAREAGGPLPEPFLRVLDDVAARLLAPDATDAQRLAAVGFPPGRRGGPSPARLAATDMDNYLLCSRLWLAATGGRYSAGDAAPHPLPAGAYAAVAAQLGVTLDERTKAKWKTAWKRFRSKGTPARENALADALRTWAGDSSQ